MRDRDRGRDGHAGHYCILTVLGPLFSNNDDAIVQHCLLHNEQDLQHWLKDDDILLLDYGVNELPPFSISNENSYLLIWYVELKFRNAEITTEKLKLRAEIPSFLNGRKQFSTDHANRTYLLTKLRWVVENGKRIYVKFCFIVIFQSS